jgi:hypothetical protein
MTFEKVLEGRSVDHFPVIEFVRLQKIDLLLAHSQQHAPDLDQFSVLGHVVVDVHFH